MEREWEGMKKERGEKDHEIERRGEREKEIEGRKIKRERERERGH